MNYLAHAFLSNSNKDLLIGNFIADHVRGNNFDVYTPDIINGIYLHRRIDTFTDAHPLFKESKRFFYNGFEKYSGVLVDIYFDHLLARNFSKYSSISLNDFAQDVYKIYSANEKFLPKTSFGFLEYVIRNNIYTSYANPAGIEQVLSHLSHRIKHKVQLDRSMALFLENESKLESNFGQFFDDAIGEFL